jgi:hypothetical protein
MQGRPRITVTRLLERLIELADAAGHEALRFYADGQDAHLKVDGSPVTAAIVPHTAALRRRWNDCTPGSRYHSLGCGPCTESPSRNVGEIVAELRTGKFANIAERSGRAQDAADGGGLETLRRDGYM